LNGNDLYITENSGNKISKIDITATTPTTTTDVVTGLNGPSELLLNGSDLYITEVSGNKILKIDLSTLSINKNILNSKEQIYPNPSTNFIRISNLKAKGSYIIYNVLGAEVKNGTIDLEEIIEVQNLKNGIYLLKLYNGSTLKFLKE
ncbi:T9SS type A sorting domain-containing protein, partial [Flavobacteriaceae bacterium]|nr:T9SS type A sorting domain-containing protein [Flavobacteriaceae bacterium]